MLFPSITFLLLFLPLLLCIYFFVTPKYQNVVLLLFSIIFYAWGEPIYVVILLLSTILDYSVSIQLSKTKKPYLRKMWLGVSLLFNLGILFFFKYSVMIQKLPLFSWLPLPKHFPIGISFYTFQTMSYTIDVYRYKQEPTTSFIQFATYVTMFFQLIAGPIIRYSDVAKQLQKRNVTSQDIRLGRQCFILGLSKKVLLADNIGLLWERLSIFSSWTSLEAVMTMAAFGLQIYYDFSGYSDMAIGLAKIFGFSFPENFNCPYYATSMQDFWRRWHISLGSWFKDYVYIPLKGSRTTTKRWIFNMLCVWMLTGLWHGANWNFVLWGLYNGLFLIFEKLYLRKLKMPSWLQHTYALITIFIGWIFFAFEDASTIWQMLQSLVHLNPIITTQGLYLLTSFSFILSICILLCFPKTMQRFMKIKGIWLILLFVLCIIYIVEGSYQPFLYFRF